MRALVETLKIQHRELERRMGALDERLAAADASGAREALGALSETLMAHLALEDRELYPGLAAVGEETIGAGRKALAQTFAANMKRITDGLVSFIQSAERADAAALGREWGRIRSILVSRIESEERVLYPIYVRASAARSA
jgi:hypothetical protein